MSKHINLLDILTKDRELPEGCDAWGIRAVHPDGASRCGFVWPLTPGWVEAPGPINYANAGPVPTNIGDGICLAHSWSGMASSGIVARTLLLCAYSMSDILGRSSDDEIARFKRVRVVAVVDGERLIREDGRGADLRGADLSNTDLHDAGLNSADLVSANLSSADLCGARLHGANLCDAYLRDANLRDADLGGADLLGADLRGANLHGANLYGANLLGADLRGANLRGANLHGANLYGANLRGADLSGTVLE